MKKTRSPAYPGISLPSAIAKLERLWKSIESRSAPKDVVLKGMGFSGSKSGAGLVTLSAMRKYGLIEVDGVQRRITERGKMYLKPVAPTDKAQAIYEAAHAPRVFAELVEQFPGAETTDEMIGSYLVRQGFSELAASAALRAYRDTMALVASEAAGYTPASSHSEQEANATEDSSAAQVPSGSRATPQNMTPPAPSTFRVSMTEEFLVDVVATRLYRNNVKRLVAWLQANEGLVPEEPEYGIGTGGEELTDP